MNLSRQNPYFDGIIWLAASIGAWGFLGNMIIIPALPDMIQPLQISETQVGYIISAFTLPSIFITPFVGVLIRKYSSRFILVFSLILYGISGLLGLFSQNFFVLLFWRTIQGISAAPLLPLALLIVGDHYSVEQRSAALGVLVSLYNVIAAILPLIGGFLAQISWQMPFIAYLAAFPCAAYAQRVFSTPKKSHEENMDSLTSVTPKKTDYSYVKSAQFIIPCLVASLSYMLIMGVANTYMPIYLAYEFNFTASVTGVITSVRLFITAFSSGILGVIALRCTYKQLYLVALILTFFSYEGIILTYGLSLSILPILLCGLGHGIMVPLTHSVVYRNMPVNSKATTISIYQTIFRITQTLAPVLFGGVVLFSSLYGVFALSAFLSLLGTLAYLAILLIQRNSKQS